MRTEPVYEVGDRVKHLCGNDKDGYRMEYGIIVGRWWEDNWGWDYYIAFYREDEPPIDTRPDSPFILKYSEESLKPGWCKD